MTYRQEGRGRLEGTEDIGQREEGDEKERDSLSVLLLMLGVWRVKCLI